MINPNWRDAGDIIVKIDGKVIGEICAGTAILRKQARQTGKTEVFEGTLTMHKNKKTKAEVLDSFRVSNVKKNRRRKR